jgi:hypothetical protein
MGTEKTFAVVLFFLRKFFAAPYKLVPKLQPTRTAGVLPAH